MLHILQRFLLTCGRHGRMILILGLLGGILLPEPAIFLQKYLPVLVVLLLFVAALRIGPRNLISNKETFRTEILILLLFQVALPLCVWVAFQLFGFTGPLALALLLVCSASSIGGSPNLVILSGKNPAPAMRMLMTGTAILPFTVIPIFLLIPELGSPFAVALAAGRLLLYVALALSIAFAIRWFLLVEPSDETLGAIDGVSALLMAVLVVGLMTAVGPALRTVPMEVLKVLAIACVDNFGLQTIFWLVFHRGEFAEARVSYAVVSGNRNMALFLSSLPFAIMEPLLLFIGCYQIPMYLTPIVMGWLYRRNKSE